MSKHAKKPTKGNRSITEFFTSRPSTGTPSSQPASSQPSSSQPTLSQKASSKMALRQPSKKGNVPATLQKQPILVSSDSEPVPASSKNNRPHTSLSDSSDSVVLVPSGPSKAKPPATTKATSKTKKPVGSSRVVQSSAKTTVKRRVQPAAAGATSAKPVFRKKRKVDWDSNSDDEAFTLDPSKMNPALTRAPVPRTIPFSPKAKGKERAVETVPSSPSTRSTSSKRRRITPPEGIPAPSSDDADIEEVPSSISAEEDLVLPKHLTKNPRVVQKKAARWQREASVMSSMSELTPPPSEYPSSSPLSGPSPALKPQLAVMEDVEAVMDVDMTEAADALLGEDGRASGESEAEVSQELHPRSSFSVDNQPRSNMLPSLATPEEDYVPTDLRPTTPPPIETLPPLPPTPVALDTEAKTKLILKQIQARAEAAAKAAQNTSDEEIELRELSSDDDDDLVLRVPSTRAKAGAKPSSPRNSGRSPAGSSTQPEAGPSTAGRTTRYQFRRRSSPQSTSRRSLSPSSESDRPQPTIPKKAGANPLDKLLREKKVNDKKGKGIEGIRLAEAALADRDLLARNKGKMREEMDREEDSDDDDDIWGTGVARKVARQGARQGRPGDGSDSEGEEVQDLDITEATKHLGDEQGQAVGKILTTDRQGWLLKAKRKRKTRGLPLWTDPESDTDTPMDDDFALPPFPFTDEESKSDPVLGFLRASFGDGDARQLSYSLSLNIVSDVKDVYKPRLVAFLLSLGLSDDSYVSGQVYECLQSLRTPGSQPYHFSHMLSMRLMKIGARAEVLESHGLPCTLEEHDKVDSTIDRSYHISQIVRVVINFASRGGIELADIPDVIMALLLVGFDPSMSAEVQTLVMDAIDIVASRIPSSSEGLSEMEPIICAKLLRFAEPLTPTNRAYLFTFLRGDCPQMARIARWLAHCLLLGSNVLEKQPYSAFPALEPIAELLSPATGSKAMFDVVSGAEEEEYFEDLLCYVEILNKAMNDVAAYTLEEKKVAAATSALMTGGVPASPEKPKTELQRIKHCLDLLHGKIVDTRAAHLDRSRVKAALQQLSFRIHYTREAALKWSRSGRPAGLRAYFGGRKPHPL